MGIEFEGPQKIIHITEPTTKVTAQEIYHKAKEWEAGSNGIVFPAIIEASLLPAIQDEPIYILINNWKIKFWSGNYQANIFGTIISKDGSPIIVPPVEGDVEVIYTETLGARARSIIYDAFISHASEDKKDVATPLAEELKHRGYKIWYDEFELKLGDSLRRSIDKGLANSRYGIVILSKSFIDKKWPQYELDGLVAREMEGKELILPIWHKITKKDILRYSPPLADKKAELTEMKSIKEIADEIAIVLDIDNS